MDFTKYIEHTLLKPEATKEELVKLFDEAKNNGFKGVCVNPVNVEMAKKYLKDTDVLVVTVVGFPLGASLSVVKAFETEMAIKDGADEIDMVINISALKNKDYDCVLADVEAVKKACGDKPLKVILETDLLEKEEIKKACEICVQAKADFVKTSTGFVKNGVGAKAEDVKIMAEIVKPHGLGVKASGGIRDKAKAKDMIDAGADRLGTSSGVAIIS